MFELISQIFIVRRRMVSYIYILLKPLLGWFKWGRKPSTLGERGKWPCLSQVISSFATASSWAKNRGTKRSILNILKVAHDKFTWIDKKIPHIGIYGGRFGKTGFKDFGCMSSILAQYRWRLAIDWEATTRRAILVIIMLCDKTILNKA